MASTRLLTPGVKPFARLAAMTSCRGSFHMKPRWISVHAAGSRCWWSWHHHANWPGIWTHQAQSCEGSKWLQRRHHVWSQCECRPQLPKACQRTQAGLQCCPRSLHIVVTNQTCLPFGRLSHHQQSRGRLCLHSTDCSPVKLPSLLLQVEEPLPCTQATTPPTFLHSGIASAVSCVSPPTARQSPGASAGRRKASRCRRVVRLLS